MGRREIEEKMFADFEPLVRSAGVELLDVEMLSENKETVLRATIFRPEGITLDDCAAAQRILSDRLDETDPIPGSYSLEVSSPGLERSLRRPKEFEIYKGELCQVNLFAPQDGKRVYQGSLVGLVQDPDGTERLVIEIRDPIPGPRDTKAGRKSGGKASSPPDDKACDKPAGQVSVEQVSFDRKNVSKVKLVYSEEDLKKGRD